MPRRARTLAWLRGPPHVYRWRMDLVADIGGTNARFAVVQAATGALQHARTIAAAEHPDLATAVRAYLASIGESVGGSAQRLRRATFAVAAPTRDARIEFTNSPWAFEREALRRELGLQRLIVLNDFEALALAIPGLAASTLQRLKPGVADAFAPCAVVGPGTGLGVAALLRQGEAGPAAATRALRSQGGHVGFAPGDDVEMDLLRFMQGRVGRVGTEHLLSGRGLTHLYAFFATRAGASPDDRPMLNRLVPVAPSAISQSRWDKSSASLLVIRALRGQGRARRPHGPAPRYEQGAKYA